MAILEANDPAALRAAGLDVRECGELICDTFAEMIFVHGRVHADPHAGNIYFKASEGGLGGVNRCEVIEVEGRKRPQLVLLDHGLYYDLCEGDHDVRLNFCRYWKAGLSALGRFRCPFRFIHKNHGIIYITNRYRIYCNIYPVK